MFASFRPYGYPFEHLLSWVCSTCRWTMYFGASNTSARPYGSFFTFRPLFPFCFQGPFFDRVKPLAFGLHLRARNPMISFSYLYIQGSKCEAFHFAAEVDLREMQGPGFAVAVQKMRCGTHGLLLVSGCSGRPGTERIDRAPPCFKATLSLAHSGPKSANKIWGDIFPRFALVFLWAIAKPAHLVEHLASFPKASGEGAVDIYFPVVVVLCSVCVVAVVTARGHRGVPFVIFLWKVEVVTSLDGHERTMKSHRNGRRGMGRRGPRVVKMSRRFWRSRGHGRFWCLFWRCWRFDRSRGCTLIGSGGLRGVLRMVCRGRTGRERDAIRRDSVPKAVVFSYNGVASKSHTRYGPVKRGRSFAAMSFASHFSF